MKILSNLRSLKQICSWLKIQSGVMNVDKMCLRFEAHHTEILEYYLTTILD